MEIIFGENNYSGRNKLQKKIGNKIYYYNGKVDKALFIEDIIYSTISIHKPELKEENFCSISCFKNEKYVISFYNDITDEKQNGESSLEYSLTDFSEEEIKEYIQIIIKEQRYISDKIILVTIENNVITFNNIKNEKEESLEIKEEDIDIEVLVSGYKKYYKVFTYIGLISLVLISSLIGVPYLSEKKEGNINKLKKEESNKTIETKKIQKEIIEENIKFNKLQVKKNLFENQNFNELKKKIEDLKLPEK
jgi:hypothetical protein